MNNGRESSERDLHTYISLISDKDDMSFSEKDYSVNEIGYSQG